MYQTEKYVKNRKSRIYMMGALLAVMAAIVFLTAKPEKITCDYGDGVFYLKYPDRETMEIHVSNILSLYEEQDFIPGNAVDGIEDGDYLFGTFQNQEWGVYHAAINTGIDTVVCLETTEGYYVLNYENNVSTHSLLEAIRELAKIPE